MLIVTVDFIPGKTIELIGSVTSVCCYSKSLIGDMKANLKNWTVGGELDSYSAMLETATNIVLERLKQNALQMEADGVVGMRLVSSDIAEGAAELIAYGTAVKFVN